MGNESTPKSGRRGRAELAAVRRAKAVSLRAAGLTFAEIASAIGVTRQGAAAAVQRALDELAMETRERAERVRALELLRLDAILRAHWGKRGEVDHARVILDVGARRARLEGLDAPTRTEVTGAGGVPLHPVPPEPELDLDSLSVEQLRDLQRLLQLAGAEPTPALDVPVVARPALPPRAALAEVELVRLRPDEPLRALPKPPVKNAPE